MQADDASMASESERLQNLRYQLDQARERLDAELAKGATRDKELVASYERQVEDFRSELHSMLEAKAGANSNSNLNLNHTAAFNSLLHPSTRKLHTCKALLTIVGKSTALCCPC